VATPHFGFKVVVVENIVVTAGMKGAIRRRNGFAIVYAVACRVVRFDDQKTIRSKAGLDPAIGIEAKKSASPKFRTSSLTVHVSPSDVCDNLVGLSFNCASHFGRKRNSDRQALTCCHPRVLTFHVLSWLDSKFATVICPPHMVGKLFDAGATVMVCSL